MNKSSLRTAMFLAILAGLFILLDLSMDIWVGGIDALNWSHLIFSVVAVTSILIIIYRVMETRRKTEKVLRRAQDELENRVYERTAELERINSVLHMLINTLPAGLVITDPRGEVTLANSLARDILGENLSGIPQGGNGKTALRQMDGSLFPPGKDPLSRAIQFGETVTGVEAQLHPAEDEVATYLLLAASPVRDETGSILNGVEVIQDITEFKRIESKIEHLASFPQVNPNPILEVDATGAIVFHNPAVVRTLQRVGVEDDPRLFFPADMKAILKEGEGKKDTQYYREVQIGSKIFGETIYLTPIFNVARIYVYDITERKTAEKYMQRSLVEAQMRQAEVSALLAGSRAVLEQPEFEAAARSIFNACKGLLKAGGGYIALVTEDNSQNLPVYLDPGDSPCLVDAALPMPIRGLREQVYRTGEAIYENDFSHSRWIHLLPEGHVNLDNVLFAPLKIGGVVIGLLGLANKAGGFNENDMRLASAFAELASVALFNKRTLELLKSSEERYRSVVQASTEAIITVNLKGNIVFWNNTAEKVFGYPASEIIGEPITRIMPTHIRQAHEAGMKHALSSGESSMIGRTVEGTCLRRDGSEFPAEISLTNWQTHEGLFFTTTIRDITERKEAEEALRQMQARLALGIQERSALEERQRLARELHDSVSQALYGISLGANTALTLFETDRAKTLEALRFVLSQAQAGLTEMRSLIFELRPESLKIEGLTAALTKHIAAFRERFEIEVELSLCAEPDVPLYAKEALYRVAQEALQNAAKHAHCNHLRVRLACEPGEVILEVCDDGVGFDPEASFPGHLGLQSMRERILNAGGFLETTSAPGCGTQIRAHAPISAEQRP